MNVVDCPTRKQLSEWCLGTLDEAIGESVLEHVERCPDCESTVAELELEPDTLIDELVEALCSESSVFETRADNRDEQNCESQTNPARADSETWLGEPAPAHLRDYELLEKRGEGAMGTVFKARHTKLQRVVAVKILRHSRIDHRPSLARFAREIEAVGKLNHPHIVSAHDAGESSGMHFLVMEFVDGADVDRTVRHCGPIQVADACEIVRQAALGLQHAHEQGLVHRDIKPSNLLITKDGRVRVTDLGLALHEEDARSHDELTNTGQVMGTVDYMAPEQAADSHQVDSRADIYSLGCTLYKLLASRAPFSGPRYNSAAKKLMAHAQATPLPLESFRDDIPIELIQLVEQMMAKSSDGRPATAAQVAQELKHWTTGSDLAALVAHASDGAKQEIHTASAGEISQMAKCSRGATDVSLRNSSFRLRWWLAAAAVLVLASVAAGIIIKIKSERGPDTVVEVPNGSRTKITADGNLEVKLPKSNSDASTSHAASSDFEGAMKIERPSSPSAPAMVLSHPAGDEPPSPSVAFSHDGSLFASASAADLTIRVWHVPTGKELLRLKVPAQDPHVAGRHFPVAFSPNGKQIATGGSSIILWDLATGKRARQFADVGATTSSIAFSPDGKTLASCENRSVIHFWDLENGYLRERIHCDIDVTIVHYSSAGKLLAVSAESGSIVRVSPHGFTDPSDKAIAVGENKGDGEPASNWNVLLQGSPYSPAARARVAFLKKERTVMGLWDTESEKLLDRIPVKSDHGIVCSVAISRDRKRVALAYQDGTVDLWLIGGRRGDEEASDDSTRSTAQLIATEHLQLTHPGFSRGGFVAISSDRRLVATSSVDGTILIWNADTGWQLHQCTTDKIDDDESPLPLVFSADSAQLVSGGAEITFWDSKSGEKIRQLEVPGNCCLTVSPDGKVLAAGGTKIHLFDFASGKRLQSINQAEPVYGLFYRHDGSLMAVTRSGQMMLVLNGPSDRVISHGQVLVKPTQANPATGSGKATNKAVSQFENWDVLRKGSPYLDYGRVIVSGPSGLADSDGDATSSANDSNRPQSVNDRRSGLRFLDVASGETICELEVNAFGPVAISSDHSLVAACGSNGKVYLFRTVTREDDDSDDVNQGLGEELADVAHSEVVAGEVKLLLAQLRDTTKQKVAVDRLIKIGKPAIKPLKQGLRAYQREPKLAQIATSVLQIIEGLSAPAESQGLSIQAGPVKPSFEADESPTFVVVFENKTDAVLVGKIDSDNFDTQGLELEHLGDGTKWRLVDGLEKTGHGEAGARNQRFDNGCGPGIVVTRIETGSLVRGGSRWGIQGKQEAKKRAREHLPPGRYRATWRHRVGATRDLAIPTQERPVRYLRGEIKGMSFEFTVLPAKGAAKPTSNSVRAVIAKEQKGPANTPAVAKSPEELMKEEVHFSFLYTPLKEVAKRVSERYGTPVVIAEGVDRNAPIAIHSMDGRFAHAFELILRPRKLKYRVDGAQITIVPIDSRAYRVYLDEQWMEDKQALDVERRGYMRLRQLNCSVGRDTDTGWVDRATLQGADITDKELDILASFPHLGALEIVETQVTGNGLRHLANLEALRSLRLSENQISAEGFAHLKNLRKLKFLDLFNSNIDNEGLVHIHELSNLKSVYLRRAKVTANGIRNLQKTLPHLKIYD